MYSNICVPQHRQISCSIPTRATPTPSSCSLTSGSLQRIRAARAAHGGGTLWEDLLRVVLNTLLLVFHQAGRSFSGGRLQRRATEKIMLRHWCPRSRRLLQSVFAVGIFHNTNDIQTLSGHALSRSIGRKTHPFNI